MSEGAYDATSYKGPKFDGQPSSWNYYKKKMESYLAGLELIYLKSDTVVIRTDDYEWAGTVDAAVQAKEEMDRRKNRKAAGLLLSSIDTRTKEGQAAFDVIEGYHEDPYAGGHFCKEWKALISRYEKLECNTLEQLQK